MASDREQPEVSFVVIAHNAAATIERTLGSILAQEGLGSHEVIVIDDGSKDDTAARVMAADGAQPPIRLIQLNRNRGRGYARDTGVRSARASLIATVDSDIALPRRWLSLALGALDGADAVGGTAVPDGDVAYLHKRFGLKPRLVRHTTTVTASNALYRREIFQRASFDPALREGEDVALNHALRAVDARIRTVPELIVAHEESKDLLHTIGWLYQSGRGASRQLYRYREVRRPDVAFAGWVLTGALACILGRRRRVEGRRRAAAAVLPALYLPALAAAHVNRAFVWEPHKRRRFLGAVALDTVLLSAYLTGRLTGSARAPRPRHLSLSP